MSNYKRKRIDDSTSVVKRINSLQLTEHNTALFFSTLGNALSSSEDELFLHILQHIQTTDRLGLLQQFTKWLVHDVESLVGKLHRRMYKFKQLDVLRRLHNEWSPEGCVADKMYAELFWHLVQTHCLHGTFELFFGRAKKIPNKTRTSLKAYPVAMEDLIQFVNTLNDTHIDRNRSLPIFFLTLASASTGRDQLGALLWEKYYTKTLLFDVIVIGQLLVHFQPSSCDRLLQLVGRICDIAELDIRILCQSNALDECSFVYPLLLAIFNPKLSPLKHDWYDDSSALKTCVVAELLLTAQYRGGTCNLTARKDCLFQLICAEQPPTLHALFRQHIEMTIFASMTTTACNHPILDTIRVLRLTSHHLSNDVIEHILRFAIPTTPNMHKDIVRSAKLFEKKIQYL